MQIFKIPILHGTRPVTQVTSLAAWDRAHGLLTGSHRGQKVAHLGPSFKKIALACVRILLILRRAGGTKTGDDTIRSFS